MPTSPRATNAQRSPSSRRGRPRRRAARSASTEPGVKAVNEKEGMSEEMEMTTGAVNNNRFSTLAPEEPAPGSQEESSQPPHSHFTFRCWYRPITTTRMEAPSTSPEVSFVSKKSKEILLEAPSANDRISSAHKSEKKQALPSPSCNEDLPLVHKVRRDKVLAPPSIVFSCAKKYFVPPALPSRSTPSEPVLKPKSSKAIMGSKSSTSGPSVLALQTSTVPSTPFTSTRNPPDSSAASSTSPEAQRHSSLQPLHFSFPTASLMTSAPKPVPRRHVSPSTPYPSQTKYPTITTHPTPPPSPGQPRTSYPCTDPLAHHVRTPSWEDFNTAAEIAAVNQASRTKMVKPAKVGEGPAENFGRSRPSVMRKGSEKGRVEDGKEKEGKRDGFGGKGEDEDEDGDGEDAEWEFVGEFVGE